MNDDLAIVLTGTIIPNTTFCDYSDPDKRKKEYLNSIQYYSQFAPVHFLENSDYLIQSDDEFQYNDNLHITQFIPSKHYQKGKGYQEFEMIYTWIATCPDLPKRFIKITGRYHIKNFQKIFEECENERRDCLIIDQSKMDKYAFTQLFYCPTEYFDHHFSRLYLDADDSNHYFIEHVFYDTLINSPFCYRLFHNEPVFSGISGTSGCRLDKTAGQQRVHAVLRVINRIFDKRYLHY